MAATDTRTTTRLLEDLHDPSNDVVWEAFDARYRPIVVGFARRVGLAPPDAADVAQEVLLAFVAAYRNGAYQRGRGRLRSWLIGIAKNKVADVVQSGRRAGTPRGDSVFGAMPADEELDAMWTVQRRVAILREAVDELRRTSKLAPSTIDAFERVTAGHRAASDVASELGMSVDDV